MRVVYAILTSICFGYYSISVLHAFQAFQSTNQHIRFIERAIEESSLANAFVNGGNIRARDGAPNWLRIALAKENFDLGLHNYLTGIFEACHSAIGSFEKCLAFQTEYPQITTALLYGSIVHVWIKDINIAFRPYTRLRPFHNINMAHTTMHYLVSLYIQHTWTFMVNEVMRYDNTDQVRSMVAYVTNTFQGATTFIMTGNDALLLRAWWSSLRAQYQLAQSLFSMYQLWLRDVDMWDRASRYFMSRTAISEEEDRHAPITLLDKTMHIEQRLRHSPYFRVSAHNIQPYRQTISSIVNTGRCALVIREYCETYAPSAKFQAFLLSTSYIDQPQLLTILSEALSDRDRYLEREDEHLESESAVMRLSGQIVTECLRTEATLQVCEVVAAMWPPIYFYVSEALILREFYNTFSLLQHLQAFNRFAIDDFNTFLSRLYIQLRYFFKVAPDTLLDNWAHMKGTAEMRDLYQIFKGHDPLWDARPPSTFLLQHKLDFRTYNLRFFWHRAIDLFRAHHTEWWSSLLSMARQFDKWVGRNKCADAEIFLNGSTLWDTIRELTIIDAIQLMHAVAIRLRLWSKEKLVPDGSVDKQMAWQVMDVKGHVDAFRQLFDMCDRRYLGINLSRHNKYRIADIPTLPQIPPQSALLHARQDNHRNEVIDNEALRRGVPIVLNEVSATASSSVINFLDNESPRSSNSAKSAKTKRAWSVKSKKSIKSLKKVFKQRDATAQ